MHGNRRNRELAGGPSVPRYNSHSIQAKLVLLGEVAVGKSSIVTRFIQDKFKEYHDTTIGAAFLTQTLQVQGQVIKLNIWDTGGQERYHSLAPLYYRGVQAAVVVYDINCADTFKRAIKWVHELRTQVEGNIVIVLAGNKADLSAEYRAVQTEDARAYAEDNGLFFFEVSAKTGLAIREMFMMIANKIASEPGTGQGQGRGIQLTGDGKKQKSGCKC